MFLIFELMAQPALGHAIAIGLLAGFATPLLALAYRFVDTGLI